MPDLDFGSAEEIAAAIRRREVSPTEAVRHALDRIAAVNPALNAFVSVDAERAVAEATRLTEALARGDAVGPLAGLPLGVKDMENARGFVTTRGSRTHDAVPAPHDDLHVARLRHAGAIVVGKTNTPEFGHLPYTTNDLFGPTRNPWDLSRTPGGSSGGSAGALAAGMVPLATASDGGGSVRIPASYTGLFGLKPSLGRVPKGPDTMRGFMDVTVHGALTRTVRDAALYMDVVSGPHPLDPAALPAPPRPFLETVEDPLPRLRIGFNSTLGVTRVQPDVLREVDAAVRVFADAGHEVEEDTSAIPEMAGWWTRISAFQTLALNWDTYAERHDDFTAAYAERLDSALDVGPVDFNTFLRLRGELVTWAAGIFDRYDLLLTPTVPTEAFAAEGPQPQEVDGEPSSGIAFPYPFNFTGHPAASVRAGFTDAGLPCGLQIVGPHHRDDLVLRAARFYEQARPWDRWPEL